MDDSSSDGGGIHLGWALASLVAFGIAFYLAFSLRPCLFRDTNKRLLDAETLRYAELVSEA